jgi:hypothetical protein
VATLSCFYYTLFLFWCAIWFVLNIFYILFYMRINHSVHFILDVKHLYQKNIILHSLNYELVLKIHCESLSYYFWQSAHTTGGTNMCILHPHIMYYLSSFISSLVHSLLQQINWQYNYLFQKIISTWKKWSAGDSGPGGRISGSVCGLDPK